MTDEYIVVVTRDENLVKSIQNATTMEVIHVTDPNNTSNYSYYRKIVILDLDTLPVTESELFSWDTNSHYVVALLRDEIEEFLDNYGQYIEDIWRKPINDRLLEKRLLAVEDFLTQKRYVSEYARFIGAETRNPLASVKGYAEVLLSGMAGDLTEQQSNFVATIRSNARRMERMINDMIEAASIESDSFELHFFGKVIFDKFIQSINSQRDINKHLKHIVSFPKYVVNKQEDIPDFLADLTRLRYVIERLILNAKDSPKPIIIDVHVNDGFIHFQITDFAENSYSIDRDNTEKFSLSNQYTSTHIIRHIIEQHGGKMWLEQDNDSSTFHFTIPIAKDTDV